MGIKNIATTFVFVTSFLFGQMAIYSNPELSVSSQYGLTACSLLFAGIFLFIWMDL